MTKYWAWQSPRSHGSQLPIIDVPDSVRNNIIAMLAEFVGTFLFLFCAFVATQISNTPMITPGSYPNISNLVFSALAAGLSLMVNVWAFYHVTGGLFNPAVSVALVLVRAVSVVRGVLMFFTQILGGLAAAGVVSALFPGPLNAGTRLVGDTSIVQGLFIEMFITAQLIFVIHMLAIAKHKSTYLAPLAIGLTFFLCELIGIHYSGGAINPARALAPDVVSANFPRYHWIYWVGPMLGSLLATGFYVLLNSMRYETCDPAQDSTGQEETYGQDSNGNIYRLDPHGNNSLNGTGVGVRRSQDLESGRSIGRRVESEAESVG